MRKLVFTPGETENGVINLYPEATYQTFEGFGGAVTEAAACVYSQMDEAYKRRLMEAYFSPEGMNYQFVRIPIDSCDFSLGQYTGFERVEKYILPMLRDAERAHGGGLRIMLAPWSPPAQWKTNGKREQGGRLLPEKYAEWAKYICEYIGWYADRGFTVTRLSVQNEPHAVQTWDSCVWTAQEEKLFIRDYMWPELQRRGLGDIEIYIWDHNKERVYEWMRDIVDEETDKMVAGACFHWYSGDHFEALSLCRERFPGKKLMVSESCFEFSVYGSIDPVFAATKFSHEIIGDLNGGIVSFGDWNVLLDDEGGPNYVGNYCLAPYHYGKKGLRRQLLADYIETISRAIVPGSVRIAATRFSEGVEVTAWRRPGGDIAAVLLNKQEKEQEITLRLDGKEAKIALRPMEITAVLA